MLTSSEDTRRFWRRVSSIAVALLIVFLANRGFQCAAETNINPVSSDSRGGGK